MDLISNCQLKSGVFPDRRALRQEEIEAIGMTNEIIATQVAGTSVESQTSRQLRVHCDVSRRPRPKRRADHGG